MCEEIIFFVGSQIPGFVLFVCVWQGEDFVNGIAEIEFALEVMAIEKNRKKK